jgi:hypothetical protein
MNYPRILIISPDSLSSPNGTGLTLASLFAGWPPERLAIFFYCGEPPPQSVCANGWQLHSNNIVARFATKIARYLLRNLGDGVVAGLDTKKSSGAWQVHIGTTFQVIANLVTPGLNHQELKRIRQFKPDVIYSLLWSFSGMKVTEQATQQSGAPLAPHFMDDWPATAYKQAMFGPLWRMFLRKQLLRGLKQAPIGLAICEDMETEFRHRYNLPFVSFMRCVDETSRSGIPRTNPGAPLRLIYTGGLHLGRDQVLELVASATDKMTLAGTKCSLTIHSPRSQEHEKYAHVFDTFSSVRMGNVLPADLVDEALVHADVAVHVESFDPRATAYTRLSLSTKFPSYIAAGLPILAVGPENIASIRYVSQYDLGLVVTRPDPEEVLHCLAKLQDINNRRRFAYNSTLKEIANSRID